MSHLARWKAMSQTSRTMSSQASSALKKNFTQPFASVDRSTIVPIWSKVSLIWNSAVSTSIHLMSWASVKKPWTQSISFSWLSYGWMT